MLQSSCWITTGEALPGPQVPPIKERCRPHRLLVEDLQLAPRFVRRTARLQLVEDWLRHLANDDETQVDGLHGRLRVGMVVDAAVLGVEDLDDGLDIAVPGRVLADMGFDLEGLTAVAHVGGMDQPVVARELLFPPQPVKCLRPQFGEPVAQRCRRRGHVEIEMGGRDEIVLHIGDQAAEGAQHAGRHRNDDVPHAELARQETGDHRAGRRRRPAG